MRMKRPNAVHNLRSVLALALGCLAVAFVVQGARAADAPGNTLQSIDVQTLAGKQVQLTLHLSGPAPEPMSFTIDKPARISMDLPGTKLALPARRIDVASEGVDTVLAAEANGRARVVLNLEQLQPYTTRASGNDIVVTAVAGFDALRVGNDTHIVLNATGDFQQLAYQSDDEYVVEVQPLTKAAVAASDDKKVYSGEKLSLNFQDIDTRAVLQLLADASGQNIVVSDTVRGNV